ncbi:uncharacterized protein LOC120302146 [Crotalus tigris]|uniref:uncharacterized protein LOC120302146 n=1 Tax=Crotalus tigris TaxID=88082 RepID=UPI00192F7CE3|nr:uncharacterized protein LOC120302146 [Crotalus tigris]XP_039186073.1 uncharacterized protein LOC120302146 [Crotalus tigris]XP_039186074.1 uncharacterized protein LOC120302146 [Crotalus tigris]XP_039186075.1 uncharacterized protein LOC120302146 [Crotalus tigris]
MTYISADERQEHSRVILSCQNNQLYVQHGFKEFSVSNMQPLKNMDTRIFTGDLNPVNKGGNNAGTHLYQSMENLHWATVADPNCLPHCGNVDNKLIFHCKGTASCSRYSMEDSLTPSSPERYRHFSLPSGQGIPSAPDIAISSYAKVPPWFLSSISGDAKKILKEKLRIHSSKAPEICKPLRAQPSLNDSAARERSQCRACQQYKNGCSPNCCTIFVQHATLAHAPWVALGKQRPCFYSRLASPEDIKQEAQRRLQIRRQNSSPNLTLHCALDSQKVIKSQTMGSLNGDGERGDCKRTLEESRKADCKERLYIPTFEEFKRMRSKAALFLNGNSEIVKDKTEGTQKLEEKRSQKQDHVKEVVSVTDDDDDVDDEVFHENSQNASRFIGCEENSSTWDRSFCLINIPMARDKISEVPASSETVPVPICSSPVPRSPLQPAAAFKKEGKKDFVEGEKQGLDAKNISENLHCTGQSLVPETPSSCCPLLLDATDISSYGAKLQKMKDEFIGTALDLIKKSCTGEIALDLPSPKSFEIQKADHTFVEDCHQSTSSSSNCRRSSSDISYETPVCAKVQRECRLRPHFSDPMPTDAVKRKQLELKIAAVARHHAQKRRQERESSPPLTKATVNYVDENHHVQSSSFRSKHRWSNVSSLSADSGIAGGNEERDNADTTVGGVPRIRSSKMERADSGISQVLGRKWKNRASETLTSLQAWETHQPCTDCGGRDFPLETDVQNQNRKQGILCEKCLKCRTERKESVLEFVNTEASYGEDLRIIKEEFYLPMQAAGLLTQEQLLVVFSNIQELIDLNENFLEYLQEEIDQSFEQGDDDLMTVCIGEIFLEFVNMLPAFQTYCLQQPSSVNMLNALEKEKELLRIFLNVSQNDNTVLRRMNLRSFLIAPLQRVTKYPLLLSRIIKATMEYHPDYSSLLEAKSRIESHLEHINMKTKQEGNSWTLRSFRQDSKKNREVINIEMRETALKTMGWLREETRFVMEGPLQLAQPPDGQWVKKGSKTLKFQKMQVLLMVNIRRASESSFEPGEPGSVKDAVLVLIRDKNNGKFSLLREPLRLSNCVVSVDPNCDDAFELLEIRRESFIFRDGDKARTHHWFRQIRRYSRELGSWKKRRNALPNIMISASHNRS